MRSHDPRVKTFPNHQDPLLPTLAPLAAAPPPIRANQRQAAQVSSSKSTTARANATEESRLGFERATLLRSEAAVPVPRCLQREQLCGARGTDPTPVAKWTMLWHIVATSKVARVEWRKGSR